jgi:hypothetical protein
MQSSKYARGLIAILLLGAGARGQNTILALTHGGTALHINATSGAMTVLGSSGVTYTNCLAYSPVTGLYYTFPDPQGMVLYTVNPLTGVATSTGLNLNLPWSYISALAVLPSGVGYAVAEGNKLYSVNLSTGVATYVTTWFNSPIQGLAADAAGTLYGWVTAGPSGSLVTVNPGSGALTTIGTGAGDMQSIAFSPSGALYGARQQLFSISATTGATTPIGAGGYGDVRGIEFMTDPVPPPTVSFIPANGVVAPGGILAVVYHAPGHAGESFAPVPSLTLGTFNAPFLPQPLGIAWDALTSFYFNDPASQPILPLAGAPGAVTGTLDAAGTAVGFILPPASLPPGLSLAIYITFVTWTPASFVTVGGVGTALLY